MSPRRVNPMRQMLVDAQKLALVPAEPEPIALPPAAEPEGFDFEAWSVGVRASKIVAKLKGKHYANTRQGRNMAETVAHHIRAGEEIEIAKLREKYTFNEIPTYEQRLSNYVAQLDAGQIHHARLI